MLVDLGEGDLDAAQAFVEAVEAAVHEACDQLADVGGTIDEDIDKALTGPSPGAGADSLAELKKKMGIAVP